jgi:hypothetical protein
MSGEDAQRFESEEKDLKQTKEETVRVEVKEFLSEVEVDLEEEPAA